MMVAAHDEQHRYNGEGKYEPNVTVTAVVGLLVPPAILPMFIVFLSEVEDERKEYEQDERKVQWISYPLDDTHKMISLVEDENLVSLWACHRSQR